MLKLVLKVIIGVLLWVWTFGEVIFPVNRVGTVICLVGLIVIVHYGVDGVINVIARIVARAKSGTKAT
jgi:hypothetical protein